MTRLIAASMPSEQLANHTTDAAPLLLVGTSSFIGEGFDCPALDTLFLAARSLSRTDSSKNVERLSPPPPTTATVHDYHDELTPVLPLRCESAHPATPNWIFRPQKTGPIGAPD